MENEFSRLELLIGSQSLNKLKQASVAIFGIGGVGGHVAEALARSGVGNLDFYDNDTVSISNINRQIVALNSNIGKYKTDIMKKRALDINPKANVNAINMFFTSENAHEIDFSKYDYIVDAIDTVSSKLLLAKIAHEQNIKIISSMGAGNKLNPCGFMISDIFKTEVCPLARVMRKKLKEMKIPRLKVVYSKELPVIEHNNYGSETRPVPASCAFVPSVVGLIIASEVVNSLK